MEVGMTQSVQVRATYVYGKTLPSYDSIASKDVTVWEVCIHNMELCRYFRSNCQQWTTQISDYNHNGGPHRYLALIVTVDHTGIQF